MRKSKHGHLNKTFRLRRDHLRRLEMEAAKANMSTNGLITSILERYLEWDILAGVVRFLSLPPNMVEGILANTTEDSMAEAGKYVAEKSCFKDLSLHFFQSYDTSTWIKLALFFDRYANNYTVQWARDSDGKWVNVSLYHDYGRKWSLFLGNLLHGELIRLGVDDHTYEISQNAVIFHLQDGRIQLPAEYLEKFEDTPRD